MGVTKQLEMYFWKIQNVILNFMRLFRPENKMFDKRSSSFYPLVAKNDPGLDGMNFTFCDAKCLFFRDLLKISEMKIEIH